MLTFWACIEDVWPSKTKPFKYLLTGLWYLFNNKVLFIFQKSKIRHKYTFLCYFQFASLEVSSKQDYILDNQQKLITFGKIENKIVLKLWFLREEWVIIFEPLFKLNCFIILLFFSIETVITS